MQYLTSFLFGVFAERTYRATEMFGRLHREPAQLARLEAFFEAQGFHLTTDTRDLRVVWDREYPGKERGYLKINFRWRDRLQMNYEFRVPGYRQLMTQYEQLPLPIQGLCFSRMKVCNSCGYCTQTDKSGQRLRLAMPLTWQGETALKCPLYPWFNWNELDEYAFEGMAYLFTMAEKCLVK